MASYTGSMGVFNALPIHLLSEICKNLPMHDIVTVSLLDKRLGMFIENIIYREIKAIRVEILEQHSQIYFIHKDGRTTQLDLNHVDWEDVVKFGICIDRLEMDVWPDKSTSNIFQCLKKCQFKLKKLKLNIRGTGDSNAQKLKRLHQRFDSLVSQHRSTLLYLETSTSDEQKVVVNFENISSIRLSFVQSVKPTTSEQSKHSINQYFVYNLFHSLLDYRQVCHATLEIDIKYNASLALQKAFQMAVPHSKRTALETLTINFGSSLAAVTEDEMKQVLLRHVDEFHFTTPKLQHFHCNLPHDEIDLCQEFLAQLNEPVRNSRTSPSSRPYNSTISVRPVKCK